jgi:hypothetical protein
MSLMGFPWYHSSDCWAKPEKVTAINKTHIKPKRIKAPSKNYTGKPDKRKLVYEEAFPKTEVLEQPRFLK